MRDAGYSRRTQRTGVRNWRRSWDRPHRLIPQPEIEEVEHVIWQLVPIVRQGIGGWRGVADQWIDEKASRHSYTDVDKMLLDVTVAFTYHLDVADFSSTITWTDFVSAEFYVILCLHFHTDSVSLHFLTCFSTALNSFDRLNQSSEWWTLQVGNNWE